MTFAQFYGRIIDLYQVLAVASALPSIEHGYVSPISRQTSGHVLSFKINLTDLTLPLSNYLIFYSAGIAAGETQVLNWTALATPATINQVDQELTLLTIPDNYNITVNLKVVDTTNNNAETVYSSHELKVGDRLPSDDACADIFNPVGTSTVTPPQPQITIEYDNAQQLFHFNIVAQYLLHGYTWVVDFAPFSGNPTKGVNGLAATNCENRVAADLQGRDFAAFWNAAPAADYPGALNSENFLAYRLGDASTANWTVSAQGCSKVNITTPGFSFQDLLNCKNSNGGNSIIRAIVGNTIQYNGTLYVTAVKAVDPLNAAAGFLTTEFTVPFFVSFSVSSTSISSGTDSNIFGFSITSLGVNTDGNLALTMATNTFIAGSSLSAPTVITQPSLIGLASINTPAPATKQTWNFVTSSPSPNYSGPYSIQFTRTDGAKRSTVTVAAQFTLNLAVNSGYGNTNNVLPTSLSFFGSDSFSGSTKTTFTSLDTIFVKSTVDTVAQQDKNTYANSIYNVWLCYTIDDTMPVYDNDQQLGCTAQTWNIRPITRLVMNGAISAGVLESQFAAMINNTIPGQDSINSGFRFQAAPLATLKNGKFFIQIESRINLPTSKRSILAEQAVSNEIQTFSVANADTTNPVEPKTPIASGANVAQLAAVIVVFCGALLF